MADIPKNPSDQPTYDPRVQRARDPSTGKFVSIKDLFDKIKNVDEKIDDKNDGNEKIIEELEYKIIEVSNFNKNILSSVIKLEKRQDSFDGRLKDLEKKLSDGSKESAEHADVPILQKIKEDLVEINKGFNNIISSIFSSFN